VILTDAYLEQLLAVSPDKRLALMLLWLFDANILDNAGYVQAVTAGHPTVADDDGGVVC
jgi:hypothetical protein